MTDLVIAEKTVAINGESFVIKQLNTKQTLAAAAAIFEVIDAVQQLGEDATVAKLLTTAPDAVLRIIAVGLKRPVEFVEELPLLDTVAAAEALLEVNASFFVEQVLPKVAQLMQGVGKK